MKKNFIASLLAMSIAASLFTGCGNESDAAKADDSDTVEEKEADISATSSLDASAGRVVGANSKWDGKFTDHLGKKFWAGMTINEIVEQGCAVSPNYFSDDQDIIASSVTEMSIPPLTDSENFGSGYDCLYVWDVDGNNYSYNDFNKSLWYYNPYPYAVSFGECKVSIMASVGDIEGSDAWDTDGDGKISAEELEAVFDIAPITNEYDTHYYPFEDFVVDFSFMEGHLQSSPVSAECYEVSAYMGDELDDYSKPFKREYTTETLDNSLDTYSLNIGIDNYTVDLSYFENIEEIKRSYLEESDYTKEFSVKGTTVDGDPLTLTLTEGDYDSYGYDMEKYAKKKNLDSEQVGDETLYSRIGTSSSVTKLAGGSVMMDVKFDGHTESNHILETTHKIETLITIN